MKRAIFISLLILVAVPLLLTGCATRVTGVRQDKSLTHASIVAGKVAIGGVFSNFEEMSPKMKNRHATNLMFEIQEEREAFEVSPMPEVRNAIGRDRYEALMKEFTDDGILGKPALDEIKSKLSQRYLVVVRVESDVKEGPWWRAEAARYSKGRKTRSEGVAVGNRRTIKVTAHMYDLQKGKSVWSGQVDSYDRTSVFYPKAKTEPGKFAALSAIISGLSGGAAKGDKQKSLQETYPAPKYPSLIRLFPNAFSTFADELPDS